MASSIDTAASGAAERAGARLWAWLPALLLAQQSEWSKHDPALASGQEQGYASGQLIKLPSGRNPVLPWTSASSRLAS